MDQVSLESAFSKAGPIDGVTFASEDLGDFTTSGSRFLNCRFKDCIFDGAIVRDCEFIGCRFAHCSFKETQFVNCIFVDPAHQAGTEWSYCNFSEARLRTCNISNNRFVKCEAFLMEIVESAAVGLQFDAQVHRQISKRMMFGGVVFLKCKLQYSVFAPANYEESRLESCDLRDCSFAGSNLSRASFMESGLNNADFGGATLDQANLSHATFDELDLSSMFSFKGMTVSRDQHETLLASMGILTAN